MSHGAQKILFELDFLLSIFCLLATADFSGTKSALTSQRCEILTWRRGVVVIVTANGTEDLGFESHRG
jgi:hypothetical protein